MSDITCPECGHRSELVSIRRSSEEFCPQCDYPLFWVSSTVPATSRGANSDATLRRLPGAGGRQRVGSKVCPACGELNPLGASNCLRCTAELEPRPVVVVPAAVPPPPPPAPVIEPEPVPITTPWWWWPAAALIASAIAIPILASL